MNKPNINTVALALEYVANEFRMTDGRLHAWQLGEGLAHVRTNKPSLCERMTTEERNAFLAVGRLEEAEQLLRNLPDAYWAEAERCAAKEMRS